MEKTAKINEQTGQTGFPQKNKTVGTGGNFIRDIMTKDLTCSHPEMSLGEAICLMKKDNVGSLPVLATSGGKPVGFLTDRDIMMELASARDSSWDGVKKARVDSIMKKKIFYVFEDDSFENAAKTMCQNKIRRLLVLERSSEKLVGIVSLKHLCAKLSDNDLRDKLLCQE